MSAIFANYKIALLDATFFVSDFSEELKEGLKNIKVYIADTFEDEVAQYKAVLQDEKSRIYENNHSFILDHVTLNTLTLDRSKEEMKSIQDDTWGFITLLIGLTEKLNSKFILITGNQMLIERLITRNAHVDIFDLKRQSFIHCTDFDSLRDRFCLKDAEWEKAPVHKKVAENSVLYTSSGKPVLVESHINSGMEADIWRVSGVDNSVVKIFNDGKMSAGKFNHVKKMAELNSIIDIDWACLPSDIVYHDQELTNPAGILERCVDVGSDLSESSLFTGDPYNVEPEDMAQKQSDIIKLCLKIVRQVCYLNTYGFFLSDYNLGNFAIRKDDTETIHMWDSDSFGYGHYFGKVFAPDYAECVNHPKYDTKSKDGAIASCNDALYQGIFKILTLGDSPINDMKGTFKYDNPKYMGAIKREFMISNVWEHMAEVFRGEKEPSSEALMRQLIIALEQLENMQVKDKSVEELFIEFIPGFEEEDDFADDFVEPVSRKIDHVDHGSTMSISQSSSGSAYVPTQERNWAPAANAADTEEPLEYEIPYFIPNEEETMQSRNTKLITALIIIAVIALAIFSGLRVAAAEVVGAQIFDLENGLNILQQIVGNIVSSIFLRG